MVPFSLIADEAGAAGGAGTLRFDLGGFALQYTLRFEVRGRRRGSVFEFRS